jgi:hypothetical protein
MEIEAPNYDARSPSPCGRCRRVLAILVSLLAFAGPEFSFCAVGALSSVMGCLRPLGALRCGGEGRRSFQMLAVLYS